MLDPHSISLLARDVAQTARQLKGSLRSLPPETARMLGALVRQADLDLRVAFDARCDDRRDEAAEGRVRAALQSAGAISTQRNPGGGAK